VQTTYETLFIINPDLEESEITKTIDAVQEVITAGGGTILKVDRWGRRQLAYLIQNKREGYYVIIYFQAPSTVINELNRRYKLTDSIMRNLVVQLNKNQVEEILRSVSSPETTVSTEAESSDSPSAHDEDKHDETVESEAEEKQNVSMEG
jgi:small subunit ribosomal protein S6